MQALRAFFRHLRRALRRWWRRLTGRQPRPEEVKGMSVDRLPPARTYESDTVIQISSRRAIRAAMRLAEPPKKKVRKRDEDRRKLRAMRDRRIAELEEIVRSHTLRHKASGPPEGEAAGRWRRFWKALLCWRDA